MKGTRLENSRCPIARSLDVIGDWRSRLIVRDALGGGPGASANFKNTLALLRTCSPGG